jgi:hypothetical protein
VTFVEGTVTFAEGAVTFVGGAVTLVDGAVTFIGKGSSAVRRLFKIAGAELYRCWVGCGGLYGLGCRRSLALVKEEGKASGACVGGACADGACVDGACVDGACVGGAYVDGVACWGIDDINGVNKRDLRR